MLTMRYGAANGVRASVVMLCLLFVAGCEELKRINELPVAKGHSAKQLCSYVFNSGFDPIRAKWRFVAPDVSIFPLIWKTDIDYDKQTVTVSDFIFLNESMKQKAVYREGLGCTSLVEKTPEQLIGEQLEYGVPPVLDNSLPWPNGTLGVSPNSVENLDYNKLDQAITQAFNEDRDVAKNTTSLLVAYKGELIAEEYGLGVTADDPLIGWSMTKSITSTLVGILVDRGLLDVNEAAPIKAWENTEKQDITLDNLLTMSSGLDYEEGNSKLSNSTQMLYLESDQAAYMAGLELIHEPGSEFNYSTGETNLIASIVQATVGGTSQDGYDFYQNELFYKIGIRSAFIEIDESGQFVGGAYGHLTARDWARLGQLYLQRGNWNGEQVISEEWIDYATTPSSANDTYGAQIWINTDQQYFEGYDIPEDTYVFAGYHGQTVVIVPSKDLVMVRTGVYRSVNNVIVAEVLEEILEALPN